MQLVIGILLWMIGEKLGMGPWYFVWIALGVILDIIAIITKAANQ